MFFFETNKENVKGHKNLRPYTNVFYIAWTKFILIPNEKWTFD